MLPHTQYTVPTLDISHGWTTGISRSLLSIYLLPVMGSYDRFTYEDNGWQIFVFFLTTFIANIVMLNALIAIMSDTFSKQSGRVKKLGLYLQVGHPQQQETLRSLVGGPSHDPSLCMMESHDSTTIVEAIAWGHRMPCIARGASCVR